MTLFSRPFLWALLLFIPCGGITALSSSKISYIQYLISNTQYDRAIESMFSEDPLELDQDFIRLYFAIVNAMDEANIIYDSKTDTLIVKDYELSLSKIREVYDQAIYQNSKDGQLFLQISQFEYNLLQKEIIDDNGETLERCLNATENALYYNSEAKYLYEKLGYMYLLYSDYEKAQNYLKASILLNLNLERPYFLLATSYYLQENYVEAIKTLDKIKPTLSVESQIILCKSYLGLNKISEAYKLVLQLEKSNYDITLIFTSIVRSCIETKNRTMLQNAVKFSFNKPSKTYFKIISNEIHTYDDLEVYLNESKIQRTRIQKSNPSLSLEMGIIELKLITELNPEDITSRKSLLNFCDLLLKSLSANLNSVIEYSELKAKFTEKL